MTTITARVIPPLIVSDSPADAVTPDTLPPPAAAPARAAPARQNSLQERAIGASRTRLNTLALSLEPRLSSSALLPDLARMTLGSAPVKTTLYQPQKRRNENFNNQVDLGPRQLDADSHLGRSHVACRHLAFEYFNGEKKADFLSAVNSKAAIKRYFGQGKLRAVNQAFNHVTGAATLRNASVVTADMFRFQLVDIVQTLRRTGQANADFLLTSGSHAMALNFQIKDQRRVCATLYDPNVTTNHYRVETANLEDLSPLRRLEIPLEGYRRKGSHAFTLHARADFFDPAKAMTNLRSHAGSNALEVMTGFIRSALNRDDPALLLELMGKAVAANPRGGATLKAMLQATDRGFPGLFEALQNGRTDAVSTWMAATRRLAGKGLLSSSDLFELFKVKATVGELSNSGLNQAIFSQRPNTVSAFMGQVTDAAVKGLLNTDQVKTIFSAPNPAHTPAIDTLWCNADLATFAAVVHQLGRSHRLKVLDSDDVKALLLGRGPEMTEDALDGASAEEIQAFAQVLKPLVDQGVLRSSDLKALFAARGYGPKRPG
ncbi:ShET2/EspL2 family type III secretion system effector toxin [Pseudomonas sp. SDO528_S397]